jgi:hypothetical protein
MIPPSPQAFHFITQQYGRVGYNHCSEEGRMPFGAVTVDKNIQQRVKTVVCKKTNKKK